MLSRSADAALAFLGDAEGQALPGEPSALVRRPRRRPMAHSHSI